jgi:hypothetical protein
MYEIDVRRADLTTEDEMQSRKSFLIQDSFYKSRDRRRYPVLPSLRS